MRYPKTAFLFEGTTNSGYDGCVAGKVYEFTDAGYGSSEGAVIWAIDPFDGEPPSIWQHALLVKHLKPLTPAAEMLLKNMPRKVGRDLDDAVEVVVD